MAATLDEMLMLGLSNEFYQNSQEPKLAKLARDGSMVILSCAKLSIQ